MKLSDKQEKIILTFADNDMNLSKTARVLYIANSTVEYHFKKIMNDTCLCPKRFYDLVKLVKMCN